MVNQCYCSALLLTVSASPRESHNLTCLRLTGSVRAINLNERQYGSGQQDRALLRAQRSHDLRRCSSYCGHSSPRPALIQRTQAGDTVDTIRKAYPHLTPAQIHDALSYAYDHLAETEEEIRQEDKAYNTVRFL